MSSPTRFVHISDTHFGPTTEFSLYGVNAYESAAKMVQAINGLPTQPDFVIHTGDVAASPDPSAYRLAADVFSRLRAPVYFVIGNHDAAQMMHRGLPMAPKQDGSSEDTTLSYTFTVGGYRFIALDARGPDAIDPHGVLATHQIDFLEREIHRDTQRLGIFVHFPPLPLDSLWYDESMLLLNGEMLHQSLVQVHHRVAGVFFGHVHRGIQIMKEGILYSGVASTVGQFLAHPHLTRAVVDAHHPPCFNMVTFTDHQTIVKEYMIPAPRT